MALNVTEKNYITRSLGEKNYYPKQTTRLKSQMVGP